jgi:hypothetical protein
MTFVIIRPSYVAALNSPVAAAICSLFEHWSLWKAHNGPDLWIYKKQDELQADLFGMFGVKQIRAALSDLVNAGILSRRTNPHRATDRTFQYMYKPNRLAELLRQLEHEEAKGEADRLQTVEARIANGQFAASSLEQIRLFKDDSAKAAESQSRPAAAAGLDADLHSSMRGHRGEGPDREQTADEGLDATRRAAAPPPTPSPAVVGEVSAAISGVFAPIVARQLIARYGAATVERALTVARERGAKNPAGFALKLLRDADPALEPHPPAAVASPAHQNAGEWESERRFDEWLAQLRTTDAPTEQPADPARDAWRLAHAQLEIQLDRANFQTWVRDAAFVRAESDRWTIRAAHSMARDQLQHRLYKDIRRVLSDVVGRKVEIEFVVEARA